MKDYPTSMRRFTRSALLLLPLLLLHACESVAPAAVAQRAAPAAPRPPIATPHPFAVSSPQGTRNDDYYWLRDDTRKSRAVLDYQVTQGELRQLKVRLPAGQRLLRVEGELIRTWELEIGRAHV